MKRIVTILLMALISLAGTAQRRYTFDRLPGTVYYESTAPITEGNSGELAIILIHGWNGGVKEGTKYVQALTENYPGVYYLLPRFPTPLSMKKFGVEPDGRSIWNTSWTTDLSKRGRAKDDWRGGGDAAGVKLSSFEVVDHMLRVLSDKKLYPNLRKIVLAGFSAGGQFVNRYVAVGKGKVRKGLKLEYVSMSPSTDLYFEDGLSWHYGLDNRPRYCKGVTLKQMNANLSSRRILCACGVEDVGPVSLDVSDEAMRHGKNRYDRFLKYQEYVKQHPEWAAMTTFVSIPGIAHESGKAYAFADVVKFILSE